MKKNYILFCDAANRSIEGKFNLLGIFDTIYIPKDVPLDAPLIHPTMFLAFEFSDMEKMNAGVVRITMTHQPSGKKIFENEGVFDAIPSKNHKLNGMVPVQMMPVMEGSYEVKIELNDEKLGECYLKAERQK